MMARKLTIEHPAKSGQQQNDSALRWRQPLLSCSLAPSYRPGHEELGEREEEVGDVDPNLPMLASFVLSIRGLRPSGRLRYPS